MSEKTFRKAQWVGFSNADPAARLFYGRVLEFGHYAIEAFIVEGMDIAWDQWFSGKDRIVPIRQAHAEYRAPILPGRYYDFEIMVRDIRAHSVSFFCRVLDASNPNPLAEIETVHVFLEPDGSKKSKIPEDFVRRLEQHLKPSPVS